MRDELDPGGGDLLDESGEAWPDEPDEFDPRSLGPEVPSAPDPTDDDVEVSAELAKAFWSAVLFANVGLLGVSLGPMLAYFEGRTDLGLAVFLVGVLGLAFTYRRYHGYMNRDEGDDGDGDGEDGGDTGTDGSGHGADDRGGADAATSDDGRRGTGAAGTAGGERADRERDHRGSGGGD